MQNRYVGDLGDFGKYSLLKALCSPNQPDGGQAFSLGVVWYLVPDEGHNDDGKYIQYLEPSARNQERYRVCDPPLYDALRNIILTDARNVTSIRERQVLSPETRYYEAALTFDGVNATGSRLREQRIARRRSWLQDALELTSGCDVVFIDPDNGLEVKVGPYQKRGPKYAFFDELLPYLQRNQSLVIYHHIARRGSALDQIKGRLAQIEGLLGYRASAMLYHRGSARAFFIVPVQRHREILFSRSEKFLCSPWARHFELVGPG